MKHSPGSDIDPDGFYLIGIDPGASGGVAFLPVEDSVDRFVRAVPMPDTERDVWDLFSGFTNPRSCFAVIEKVGGYVSGAGGNGSETPKGGGAANGSSMFKFGRSYGGLRMALIASGIPFEEVAPQVWQKKLGIPPRKKAARKRTTVSVPQPPLSSTGKAPKAPIGSLQPAPPARPPHPVSLSSGSFFSGNIWYEAVVPATDSGETKYQFKSRLRARAQQLFPDLKVTHSTADALLIAEYVRRTRV